MVRIVENHNSSNDQVCVPKNVGTTYNVVLSTKPLPRDVASGGILGSKISHLFHHYNILFHFAHFYPWEYSISLSKPL